MKNQDTKNRDSLDEALSNMFLSEKYKDSTLFYAHMLSQVNIIIEDIPAPAGVSFEIDHYILYINNEKFSKYSLDERMFILIHEMLHILMGHLDIRKSLSTEPDNSSLKYKIKMVLQDKSSKFIQDLKNKVFKDLNEMYNYILEISSNSEDVLDISCESEGLEELDCSLFDNVLDSSDILYINTDQLMKNYATDCAINQLIPKIKIPDDAIVPDNFPAEGKIPVKANAEVYYDLLKKSNNANNSSIESYDTHVTWKPSSDVSEIMKDVTKKMIDQSIQETQEQRGSLPENIQDMINLFSRKSQVNWKKVLKNMVGKKKIGKRLTIMRKSRRFPKREDVKGVAKDRKFNLIVLVDVSGSMSTAEINQGLSEIHTICKQNNTSMKLIQIDTEVKAVEEFTAKTKIFKRLGRGGTIMEAGITYILENNIQCDGIVFITDGYIENVSEWKKQPKCRVMWLCTTPGVEISGIKNLQKHSQFDLKVN